MKWFYAMIGFAALCCSATMYADSIDPITQGNSNADHITAQSQKNMAQQQQILAQRLQSLSAAMQAQNPTVPIVAQPAPQVQQQPTPVTPPAAEPLPPQVTATPEKSAPNRSPSTQKNNSSQWDYGF